LTFRTSKKHKAQESTRSVKNALKLASKFQHFLNTGVASKKDLKDVDERFISQVSQHGDRILSMLDQLKEISSSTEGQESLSLACELWAKLLSNLDSKENLGYSNLKFVEGVTDDAQGSLLEAVVDAETHFFHMLLALKSTLSSSLKNPESLDGGFCTSILGNAKEVIDGYHSRQRLLAKIVNPNSRKP
jgi:hypothetical protein